LRHDALVASLQLTRDELGESSKLQDALQTQVDQLKVELASKTSPISVPNSANAEHESFASQHSSLNAELKSTLDAKVKKNSIGYSLYSHGIRLYKMFLHKVAEVEALRMELTEIKVVLLAEKIVDSCPTACIIISFYVFERIARISRKFLFFVFFAAKPV
jgi:hypothetical protein